MIIAYHILAFNLRQKKYPLTFKCSQGVSLYIDQLEFENHNFISGY